MNHIERLYKRGYYDWFNNFGLNYFDVSKDEFVNHYLKNNSYFVTFKFVQNRIRKRKKDLNLPLFSSCVEGENINLYYNKMAHYLLGNNFRKGWKKNHLPFFFVWLDVDHSKYQNIYNYKYEDLIGLHYHAILVLHDNCVDRFSDWNSDYNRIVRIYNRQEIGSIKAEKIDLDSFNIYKTISYSSKFSRKTYRIEIPLNDDVLIYPTHLHDYKRDRLLLESKSYFL